MYSPLLYRTAPPDVHEAIIRQSIEIVRPGGEVVFGVFTAEARNQILNIGCELNMKKLFASSTDACRLIVLQKPHFAPNNILTHAAIARNDVVPDALDAVAALGAYAGYKTMDLGVSNQSETLLGAGALLVGSSIELMGASIPGSVADEQVFADRHAATASDADAGIAIGVTDANRGVPGNDESAIFMHRTGMRKIVPPVPLNRRDDYMYWRHEANKTRWYDIFGFYDSYAQMRVLRELDSYHDEVDDYNHQQKLLRQ
jgi:hypothetical protein